MIFGEARNELSPDLLREAVGSVVRNRVESNITWWGNTYHEVITKKSQFSAFNESDKNRIFIEDPLHTGNTIDKLSWRDIYEISGRILSGEISDPTNGADHYYSNNIPKPSYYKEKTPTLEIKNKPDQNGNQITTYFYKIQ